MNLLTIWLRTLFLLALMLLVLSSRTPDFDKADSLYAVAQYVRWPKNGQPLTFCIKGSDISLSRLEQVIENKTIRGRSLQAKTIAGSPQSHDCNVLYSNTKNAGQGILTVSSQNDFAENGGMVEFLNSTGNQFNINKTSADKAGVKFSSNILKIAKKVY